MRRLNLYQLSMPASSMDVDLMTIGSILVTTTSLLSFIQAHVNDVIAWHAHFWPEVRNH